MSKKEYQHDNHQESQEYEAEHSHDHGEHHAHEGHHQDHEEHHDHEGHHHDHEEHHDHEGHHHAHEEHHDHEGHHHEDEDECGCGHDHHHHHDEEDDECGCGHDHHHHHDEEEDECGCGHDHHHHEDEDECGCGEEHHHHHHHPEQVEIPHCPSCGKTLEECQCDLEGGKYKKQVFILENLGCANCAAKMEAKINALPQVHTATITFATNQLCVTAKDPVALQEEFQKICSSIESEVVVKVREKTSRREENEEEKHQRKQEGIEIIAGAVLFLLGLCTQNSFPLVSLLLLVVGYVVLGREIVITAVKNMLKGKVFDENFLMTIATLGAFAIKEYPEAVGVMLFYRIGELFEHIAVEKSRSQIMETIDMRAENVTLVTGEDTKVIPSQDAKVGDVIVIKPGERIPLDGVLIDGETRIDTSPVTGEPVPVGVKSGDRVVSGCVNLSGVVQMKVEKVLEESMVSRIMDSVENAAASKPKIDKFITKFARVYTPFVVAVAVATAVIPSIVTGDWEHWVYTALTFLVISCPCALVLSVPLAFFSGIGAGSKQGILFKGGVSLEAMKKVKAVVMDKTGTITEGNFVVQQVIAQNNISEEELLSLAAACEANSTHPIGVSIVHAAKQRNLAVKKAEKITELSGHGIQATIDGKQVLCGNRKLMNQQKVDCSAYKKEGYGTEVLLAVNGVYAGQLVISDTIKKDAKSAIRQLNKQGFVTVMLTGDAEENAKAVAEETGVSKVYAKLLPEEKLEKLQEIRKQSGDVMFVGDGINDAPVLAGANVGAAMGSGADAAIEAADVVFMTSDMEAIPTAMKIAKATGRISMENVVFALVIKAMIMILGLAGIASMWLAVFADTGVAMLCVLNSIRILYQKRK